MTAIRRVGRLCALAAFAAALLACPTNEKRSVMNPDFSINIARPDADWPHEDSELTPAQEEILRLRGTPDYFHIVWSEFEDVVDQQTWKDLKSNPLESKRGREERWLYIEDRVAISFPTPGRYDIKPMSDKLLTVTQYGDPQRVELMPGRRGGDSETEKWTYYSRGKIITFEDGVKSNTVTIPRMRHFNIR